MLVAEEEGQEMMRMKKAKSEFNWKFFVIGIIILGVVYAGLSIATSKGVFRKEQVVYCSFEKSIEDDYLSRHECGILKIKTKHMNDIDFDRFYNLKYDTKCSHNLDNLTKCEGETYHFSVQILVNFCKEYPCDIEGVVCGAWYITYGNNTTPTLQDDYENNMFSLPDVESEELLLKMVERCGEDG